jgi:hypothetical protein
MTFLLVSSRLHLADLDPDNLPAGDTLPVTAEQHEQVRQALIWASQDFEDALGDMTITVPAERARQYAEGLTTTTPELRMAHIAFAHPTYGMTTELLVATIIWSLESFADTTARNYPQAPDLSQIERWSATLDDLDADTLDLYASAAAFFIACGGFITATVDGPGTTSTQ